MNGGNAGDDTGKDAVTLSRVFVDFMKTDGSHRIVLSTVGTRKDLDRLGIELQPGLLLHVYSDDLDDEGNEDPLLAEGVVEFNDIIQRWVLRLIGHIRHASDDRTIGRTRET